MALDSGPKISMFCIRNNPIFTLQMACNTKEEKQVVNTYQPLMATINIFTLNSIQCIPITNGEPQITSFKACLKGIMCAINFYNLEIHSINGLAFCVVHEIMESWMCIVQRPNLKSTVQSIVHYALCKDLISKAALPLLRLNQIKALALAIAEKLSFSTFDE